MQVHELDHEHLHDVSTNGHRFGVIDVQADSQAADGLMGTAVIEAGWKVR